MCLFGFKFFCFFYEKDFGVFEMEMCMLYRFVCFSGMLFFYGLFFYFFCVECFLVECNGVVYLVWFYYKVRYYLFIYDFCYDVRFDFYKILIKFLVIIVYRFLNKFWF